MSTPNISIAICHGSFGTDKSQEPLIVALKARGIDAICPSLPTSEAIPRSDAHPIHSDDVAVFRTALSELIDKNGKTVLVIAHSAGGLPATEAISPDLDYKTRKAQGLSGGVIGIFYMASFVIPPGQSQDEFFMGNFPLEDILANYAFKSYPEKGEYQMGSVPFYIIPRDPASLLFNGLPEVEAKKWAEGIVELPGPQSTMLINASYLRLPCAYLYTKQDRILPFTLQKEMVVKARALGAQFQEYTFDGGHSPQLLDTEGVVGNVLDFADSILKA